MIEVYLESMATGAGVWFGLPMDDKKLEKLVDTFTQGGRHDVIIKDYEGPIRIGEFANLQQLNTLVKELEEAAKDAGIGEEELQALLEVVDDPEEALQYIEDGAVRFYRAESWEDLAMDLVYDYDWMEIPERLRGYIDYEKLGRDLQYEGNFYKASNGYFVELID